MTKRTSAFDVQIGSRVRMRRLMLEISQEKLADALGITFQQVQKYEKGANRISSGRLIDIAKALQTTTAFFFDGLAAEAPAVDSDAAVIAAFTATRDGIAVARAFSKIDPKVRHAFVGLIEQVAQGA